MIVEPRSHLEPDSEGLLREISRHINDEMLEEIAAAEYGLDKEKQFMVLRQVRETGTFPPDMHRFPMEVMELIRWSEPEDPAWRPGRTGEFGHWMRAFSCAAILRVEYAPYNYHYNNGCIDSAVIQMVLSLRALPVDFNSHAAKFFAWLMLNSEPEGRDNRVCAYGIGLFWFALRLNPSPSDEILISLGTWTLRRADELFGKYSLDRLPGLREMAVESQKQTSWERLGRELSLLDVSGHCYELQGLVTKIGEQLAGWNSRRRPA
ncbi:MAG: hypothetical protein ABSG51_03255 [Terracidiphilus sp.]|jgi:hypothetical protein